MQSFKLIVIAEIGSLSTAKNQVNCQSEMAGHQLALKSKTETSLVKLTGPKLIHHSFCVVTRIHELNRVVSSFLIAEMSVASFCRKICFKVCMRKSSNACGKRSLLKSQNMNLLMIFLHKQPVAILSAAGSIYVNIHFYFRYI